MNQSHTRTCITDLIYTANEPESHKNLYHWPDLYSQWTRVTQEPVSLTWFIQPMNQSHTRTCITDLIYTANEPESHKNLYHWPDLYSQWTRVTQEPVSLTWFIQPMNQSHTRTCITDLIYTANEPESHKNLYHWPDLYSQWTRVTQEPVSLTWFIQPMNQSHTRTCITDLIYTANEPESHKNLYHWPDLYSQWTRVTQEPVSLTWFIQPMNQSHTRTCITDLIYTANEPESHKNLYHWPDLYSQWTRVTQEPVSLTWFIQPMNQSHTRACITDLIYTANEPESHKNLYHWPDLYSQWTRVTQEPVSLTWFIQPMNQSHTRTCITDLIYTANEPESHKNLYHWPDLYSQWTRVTQEPVSLTWFIQPMNQSHTRTCITDLIYTANEPESHKNLYHWPDLYSQWTRVTQEPISLTWFIQPMNQSHTRTCITDLIYTANEPESHKNLYHWPDLYSQWTRVTQEPVSLTWFIQPMNQSHTRTCISADLYSQWTRVTQEPVSLTWFIQPMNQSHTRTCITDLIYTANEPESHKNLYHWPDLYSQWTRVTQEPVSLTWFIQPMNQSHTRTCITDLIYTANEPESHKNLYHWPDLYSQWTRVTQEPDLCIKNLTWFIQPMNQSHTRTCITDLIYTANEPESHKNLYHWPDLYSQWTRVTQEPVSLTWFIQPMNQSHTRTCITDLIYTANEPESHKNLYHWPDLYSQWTRVTQEPVSLTWFIQPMNQSHTRTCITDLIYTANEPESHKNLYHWPDLYSQWTRVTQEPVSLTWFIQPMNQSHTRTCITDLIYTANEPESHKNLYHWPDLYSQWTRVTQEPVSLTWFIQPMNQSHTRTCITDLIYTANEPESHKNLYHWPDLYSQWTRVTQEPVSLTWFIQPMNQSHTRTCITDLIYTANEPESHKNLYHWPDLYSQWTRVTQEPVSLTWFIQPMNQSHTRTCITDLIYTANEPESHKNLYHWPDLYSQWTRVTQEPVSLTWFIQPMNQSHTRTCIPDLIYTTNEPESHKNLYHWPDLYNQYSQWTRVTQEPVSLTWFIQPMNQSHTRTCITDLIYTANEPESHKNLYHWPDLYSQWTREPESHKNLYHWPDLYSQWTRVTQEPVSLTWFIQPMNQSHTRTCITDLIYTANEPESHKNLIYTANEPESHKNLYHWPDLWTRVTQEPVSLTWFIQPMNQSHTRTCITDLIYTANEPTRTCIPDLIYTTNEPESHKNLYHWPDLYNQWTRVTHWPDLYSQWTRVTQEPVSLTWFIQPMNQSHTRTCITDLIYTANEPESHKNLYHRPDLYSQWTRVTQEPVSLTWFIQPMNQSHTRTCITDWFIQPMNQSHTRTCIADLIYTANEPESHKNLYRCLDLYNQWTRVTQEPVSLTWFIQPMNQSHTRTCITDCITDLIDLYTWFIQPMNQSHTRTQWTRVTQEPVSPVSLTWFIQNQSHNDLYSQWTRVTQEPVSLTWFIQPMNQSHTRTCITDLIYTANEPESHKNLYHWPDLYSQLTRVTQVPVSLTWFIQPMNQSHTSTCITDLIYTANEPESHKNLYHWLDLYNQWTRVTQEPVSLTWFIQPMNQSHTRTCITDLIYTANEPESHKNLYHWPDLYSQWTRVTQEPVSLTWFIQPMNQSHTRTCITDLIYTANEQNKCFLLYCL